MYRVHGFLPQAPTPFPAPALHTQPRPAQGCCSEEAVPIPRAQGLSCSWGLGLKEQEGSGGECVIIASGEGTVLVQGNLSVPVLPASVCPKQP